MIVPDVTPEGKALTSLILDAWRTVSADESNLQWARRLAGGILASSWLAQRDARIRAEAWDEGYQAAHDRPFMPGDDEPNPYREAQP